MSSRVKSVFLSRFMFWVVALGVGSYFLFYVDWKVFNEGKASSVVERFFRSIKISNMNLGIDLQGGAHLVVSVDIDKAVDNRLVSEGKLIEQLFKQKQLAKLPQKKEIKDQALEMVFESEDAASAAAQIVKKDAPYLAVARKGMIMSVTLPTSEAQRIRSQSVEQAVSVLKRRLDTAGVQGLIVQQHGERQIVIQLPGAQDVDEKKELISKTAHLEFKLIEKEASTREALLDAFDGELPADKDIVVGREARNDRFYLVSAFPDVTGDHIIFAKEDFDEYGKMQVSFTLDSLGTREFAELTERNVGRHLGIIIDNVMYSAPGIQGPIPNGHGRILGEYSSEDARALANVLNSGALSAPIKFEYETVVGASLGSDSIYKGIMSCLLALILLFIFGLFFYGISGFFAFLALLVNLFLVVFFLSWFKFALTLPGIAGLVLTVGMAIDASVLIYERAREELMKGESIRKAIADGFNGAITIILDANIVMFLTGLVLFKFGGPAVRGFAVTLMAGIVATIVAGIFFLKALLLFVMDNTRLERFGIYNKK